MENTETKLEKKILMEGFNWLITHDFSRFKMNTIILLVLLPTEMPYGHTQYFLTISWLNVENCKPRFLLAYIKLRNYTELTVSSPF